MKVREELQLRCNCWTTEEIYPVSTIFSTSNYFIMKSILERAQLKLPFADQTRCHPYVLGSWHCQPCEAT